MAATAQKGSAGSAQNYARLVSAYGPTSTTVSDRAPLLAKDVFDKVAMLAVIAFVAGGASAVVKLSVGYAFGSMLVATGFAFGAIFKPTMARVFAPAYAVFVGVALGVLSRFYATGNGKVVPLAILGTSAIFFAVLVLYRSGLVRVTHRFFQVTLVAGFGLLAMMVAVMLGLNLPYTSKGTTSLIVFGVLYLVVAVMNLFVDFNYVYEAQKAGVSKEGEWYAALSIMIALVMVYLALLRILGNRR